MEELWECYARDVTVPGSPQQWTGEPTQAQLRQFSRGIMDETFPQSGPSGGIVLTSQAIFAAIVAAYAGDVVSGLAFAVQTAGAGAAPTNFWLALYDLAGNRLALSADSAGDAKLTSTGVKSIAFATAYTVPAGSTGCFYAAVLQNGVFAMTPVQILGRSAITAQGAALGANAIPAVTQTAQATMPNPATLVAGSVYPWLALV